MRTLKKTLATLAISTAMTAMVFNFSACSEESPLQPTGPGTAEISQKPTPRFVSFGNRPTTLAKTVGVTAKVTKSKGGELKLKHEWKTEAGKKVKVEIKLKVQAESINKDGEFALELDEQVFLGNLDATFHPHGIIFSKPALLSIKAEGLDLSDFDEGELGLYYDNEETGEWEKMEWEEIDVDIKEGKISLQGGQLPHFSRYALGGD